MILVRLLANANLGFARDDLYVRVHGAQVSGKQHSLQLTATLYSKNGVIVCFRFSLCSHSHFKGPSLAAGLSEQAKMDFKSVVLYHDSHPKWNEGFRIEYTEDASTMGLHRGSFLHFELKAVSDSKQAETIGHAFLRLFKDDGTVLAAENQVLHLYKPSKGFDNKEINSALAEGMQSLVRTPNEAQTLHSDCLCARATRFSFR